MQKLNEILDTISRAIAMTANLPISFGRRRVAKASLADDECPLLPSEDVDRIILPRGDGLQERYEVVGGVARLTIEPEPDPPGVTATAAEGLQEGQAVYLSREDGRWVARPVPSTTARREGLIDRQAMQAEWLQMVVDEQTIPEGEPPRVRIRNREIQWSGTVVYPRQEMAEWLQSVVERTLSQRQPFRGSLPLAKHGIWHHTAQCCLNCAYFVPGKTLCCNAFHTIEDSTAINDCPDFELK